ncbi:MAG: tRNA (adenosine(37)-N6)-threonylcarbamoyltransferase complex ATPase subunit type 1 TsaE [Candidatus Manganitrophaceae bacterium]
MEEGPTMAIAADRLGQEASLILVSEEAAATAALGALIGKEASGGETIALIGPLGAGKTCFVQGLAAGLGVLDRYINSPTFILLQCYEGRLPLYHIDLYRLEREVEIEPLGFDEYFGGKGVVAIEWADKGTSILPPSRLTVTFHHTEEGRREIELRAVGENYIRWIDQIRKAGKWKILSDKR